MIFQRFSRLGFLIGVTCLLSLTPAGFAQENDCYTGGLQCARLQVPLNYSDPEGETAAIALTRLRANVSTDSPDYLGPILINPGGPGGSGVDTVIEIGAGLRVILGPQFDIVGFDPRGVRRSTPVISFYESTEERLMWDLPPAIELNRSDTMSVSAFSARSQLTGSLAAQRDKNVLAHMNTDHTARDMLTISEAYGRDKLQYWGFSYGSVLGATFAAMFPDRIHRLAIDGIVDSDADYYDMRWLGNVLYTNRTTDWFFKACLDDGPDACAFHEPSIEAMEDKLNGIYASLIKYPVTVQTNQSYALVDYPTLRAAIFSLLYTPVLWPQMAQGLQDLTKRNATVLYSIFDAPPFRCSCDTENVNPFPPAPEALVALTCNDGEVVPPGLEEAERHYNDAITNFGSWGSLFAGFRITCGNEPSSGWPTSIPKNQFRGPVTASNTSFPLLIIGNTADPVTPIEAARNVTSKFPGSVLLTQDSPGHASINAPSTCTFNYVRAYFVNGTLPPEGTVCPMNGSIFKNATASASKRDEASPDTGELLKALKSLANSRVNRQGLKPLHV
ncbi:alpha/beta-hydrolase [Marasmius fiardii PR-910]|nr:alpha/beta-hydrolase [Marasmius fiardii PR-910]